MDVGSGPEVAYLGALTVRPSLLMEIVEAQNKNNFACRMVLELIQDDIDGCLSEWSVDPAGGLRLRGRLYLSDAVELRRRVMDEGHRSRLYIHPSGTKMYIDMRRVYWWPGMNKTVGEYVSSCSTCQRVKAEYQ